MRSALSILALVIVLTIVMLVAKKQMQAIKPPAASGATSSAAGSASAAGLPQPEAVGRQVQDLMKQGEQRASEAQ